MNRRLRTAGFSIGKVLVTIAAVIIIVAVSVVAGIIIHTKWTEKLEAEKRITSIEVSERLESVSELTTEKIIYQGYIHYEEGDIPFLTKKSYSMTYTAEIEAGVDISQVKVEDNGEKIIITIPDAEVQSVYVDPDSVEFHDDSFAIFNWETKEDGVDAVKNAENDARENANIAELTEEADAHAEELIKGLFQDVISDGQLEVK